LKGGDISADERLVLGGDSAMAATIALTILELVYTVSLGTWRGKSSQPSAAHRDGCGPLRRSENMKNARGYSFYEQNHS